MKLKIGNPATGDNFFRREALKNRILRSLERDHVAFVGPRRTGKTSLLKDIESNPPEGVLAVFLDLEEFDSVPAWISAMLARTKRLLSTPAQTSWLERSGKAAKGILSHIERIEILGNEIKLTPGKPSSEAWRPMADQFLELLRESNLPIYFLLDEFPWYLGLVAKRHTPVEVESVLNWFRGMRQELAGSRTRFLVTGSIGLDGLLRRLGLSPTANDFDTLEIPPLADSEALDFLKALSTGERIPLSESAARLIIGLLGANWPILLELFLSEVQEMELAKSPTKTQLEDIYQTRMVRGARNKYCQEMFARISKEEMFSPIERRIAQDILKLLVNQSKVGMFDFESIHTRIVPDEAVRALTGNELAFVVDTLRHDGYLTRGEDGLYQFASNILRDYWKHRTA